MTRQCLNHCMVALPYLSGQKGCLDLNSIVQNLLKQMRGGFDQTLCFGPYFYIHTIMNFIKSIKLFSVYYSNIGVAVQKRTYKSKFKLSLSSLSICFTFTLYCLGKISMSHTAKAKVQAMDDFVCKSSKDLCCVA